MSFVALMAAVMCIIGPLSIPLPMSPVPITFTNLIIYLTVYLLGMRDGLLSYIVYLMLGLVGLPVFSGFTGGVSKIAGPTGGYLIGFIALALICGIFIDRFHGNRFFFIVGMILGNIANYALGTAWLAWQGNLSFTAALFAGVIPFMPGNAIKIVAATVVCVPMKRLLSKAL
jgi:biotin transport system substrate-specific component